MASPFTEFSSHDTSWLDGSALHNGEFLHAEALHDDLDFGYDMQLDNVLSYDELLSGCLAVNDTVWPNAVPAPDAADAAVSARNLNQSRDAHCEHSTPNTQPRDPGHSWTNQTTIDGTGLSREILLSNRTNTLSGHAVSVEQACQNTAHQTTSFSPGPSSGLYAFGCLDTSSAQSASPIRLYDAVTGCSPVEPTSLATDAADDPVVISRQGSNTQTPYGMNVLNKLYDGPWRNVTTQPTSWITERTVAPTSLIDAAGHIVCPSITSIPSGRQSSKILKCGYLGCTSARLFERKYELQRHMETHEPGKFPCAELGCDRIGHRAFKRREHLRNHVKNKHSRCAS